MLSSASKHALLLLQYLSEQEDGRYCSVHSIAEQTSTPAPYMSKLVKELTSLGMLDSKRGAGGGVRLHKKAERFSMLDVCQAMSDPLVKQECVLRRQPCNPKAPCAFHQQYKETRENLLYYLKMTSIAGTPVQR